LIALLLGTSCGGEAPHEPYQPPDGARDLNAWPFRVEVRTTSVLSQKLAGRAITRLDIVARMTELGDTFAPSVDLPETPVEHAVTVGVQDETSTQPTEAIHLDVYPEGRLKVQVRGYVGAELVGVGCGEKRIVIEPPENDLLVKLSAVLQDCI
jgi:hypothetical protein